MPVRPTLNSSGCSPSAIGAINEPCPPSPVAANLTGQQETWRIYYGDVRSGRSASAQARPMRSTSGNGASASIRSTTGRVERQPKGIARTFEQARAAFEAAWPDYLAGCTQADFAENLRRRASTPGKYRVHDTGAPLPTQLPSGRSKCFCGAPLTNDTIDAHIQQAHMDMIARNREVTMVSSILQYVPIGEPERGLRSLDMGDFLRAHVDDRYSQGEAERAGKGSTDRAEVRSE